MAVIFNETYGQWLTSDYTFPSSGAYRNVRMVMNLNTPTTFSLAFVTGNATGTVELTGIWLHRNGGIDSFSDGKIYFFVAFSGGFGIWITSGNPLTTGINEIFITYDGSSTANTPTFYVNGVSVSVDTYLAPSGTISNNTITNCTLGGVNWESPNGKMLACNYITGRVVSSTEVLDAYNSRLMTPNLNGIVFSPNFNGASGLQTFDGTTLGATNYIYDYITGTKFTPAFSPVGAADTYLNWK